MSKKSQLSCQASALRIDGWMDGLLGVFIFSGSLPATRIAVLSFNPLFVTFARAATAGTLALSLLLISRRQLPSRTEIVNLVIVAGSVVVGFPLLSALALLNMTSAEALLFVALLPLSTAIFAVLVAQERPKPLFWLFALAGTILVAGYAVKHDVGAASLFSSSAMSAGIIVCGWGYAVGGRLARQRDGWQVISWALVLSLPITLPVAIWQAPASLVGISWQALASMAYVSIFSTLIGFVFWYRGLAQGGIAAIGQLQLLQPFIGMGMAALLLHEPVSLNLIMIALCVALCVAGSRRCANSSH